MPTTETLFGQAVFQDNDGADAPGGWTFATQMSSSNPEAWVTALWWAPPSSATGTYDWRVYSGHIGETVSLLDSGALGSYVANEAWQRFSVGPVDVSGINFMVAIRSTASDNTYAYKAGQWPHTSGSLESGDGTTGGAFSVAGSSPDTHSALFFLIDAEVADSNLTEVSKSVDLQFDVKSSVSKSIAIQYDVFTSVSKPIALSFDEKERVSQSVSVLYDTSIGNEVTKSIHFQYQTRQRVSKPFVVQYDVRSILPKTVALKYNLRQKTYPAKVFSIRHSVRSRILRPYAVKFGVRVPIASAKSLDVLFDAKKRVSQSVAIQYDLGIVGATTVTKTLNILYHTLVVPNVDQVITVQTKPDALPPQIVTTSF